MEEQVVVEMGGIHLKIITRMHTERCMLEHAEGAREVDPCRLFGVYALAWLPW